MVGSLTGAVSSQRVTEERKGTLSTVGNRTQSVKAQGCLTARLTSRADTKVGQSDPVVPNGRAIAQRIKGTYRDWETDRKSTRLNSSHSAKSRMPSSA